MQGKCLCGGVQYEASDPQLMAHCHCSRCQHSSGTAHGTVVMVSPENFRITQGAELVHKYEEEPYTARVSCSKCGGNLYHGEHFIEAGTLIDDPGMRPSAHIMVDHKASWFDITDGLPQHGEWPPSD